MKVTMVSLAASPEGVARPGTVLDVPEQRAKELVERRHAVLFDKDRDAKKPQGWVKGSEK